MAEKGKTVEKLLQAQRQKNNDEDNYEEILDVLELRHVLTRDIDKLSGGELQRFAIALVSVQKADVS